MLSHIQQSPKHTVSVSLRIISGRFEHKKSHIPAGLYYRKARPADSFIPHRTALKFKCRQRTLPAHPSESNKVFFSVTLPIDQDCDTAAQVCTQQLCAGQLPGCSNMACSQELGHSHHTTCWPCSIYEQNQSPEDFNNRNEGCSLSYYQ